MVAHNDWASLTCRKRQIASSSFGGNARVFSRSRNEDKVLMPCDEAAVSTGIRGAGGGGGNGDDDVGDFAGEEGELATGNGMEAFFLRW